MYCNWLQFVSSFSFHSVLCITLRSAIVFNYVNFKVLYIGSENDVVSTCLVAVFVYCVAFIMEPVIMN
jgi:uncharacterized membrane protein YdbT with pleckstrin-like domain